MVNRPLLPTMYKLDVIFVYPALSVFETYAYCAPGFRVRFYFFFLDRVRKLQSLPLRVFPRKKEPRLVCAESGPCTQFCDKYTCVLDVVINNSGGWEKLQFHIQKATIVIQIRCIFSFIPKRLLPRTQQVAHTSRSRTLNIEKRVRFISESSLYFRLTSRYASRDILKYYNLRSSVAHAACDDENRRFWDFNAPVYVQASHVLLFMNSAYIYVSYYGLPLVRVRGLLFV